MANELEKILPGVIEGEVLAKHCTYKIGGPAQYFFSAKNEQELLLAIKVAKEAGLKFYIIGQGSNILFPDDGLQGLVICCTGVQVDFVAEKNEVESFFVWAGTPLAFLVKTFQERSLSGLQWAAGIPGTVGGAVFGNAGSYVTEMQDSIEKVRFIDLNDLQVKEMDKYDCEFSYRESIFKKNRDFIIVGVLLKGRKGDSEAIKKAGEKYLADRMAKHQYDFPTAGSVFKNPRGQFAGALIEQCGLKGYCSGGAMIWDKHANFIINKDKATAKDIMDLVKLAQSEVKKKFDIDLECENIIF